MCTHVVYVLLLKMRIHQLEDDLLCVQTCNWLTYYFYKNTGGAKKKMYAHVIYVLLLKMCIHFFAPSVYDSEIRYGS
jgi:hypothetical protein